MKNINMKKSKIEKNTLQSTNWLQDLHHLIPGFEDYLFKHLIAEVLTIEVEDELHHGPSNQTSPLWDNIFTMHEDMTCQGTPNVPRISHDLC